MGAQAVPALVHDEAEKFYSGKTVLVTGGTGSFGRQILRRLLRYRPSEVVVLSRDEKKQYDMKIEFSGVKNIRFIIGDIRDYAKVREAVSGADIIYQAAALKQVPNCEFFPMEAIKTNIIGANNIIEAALEEKVDVVVAVSTDKAVKPVNVMGMTKALQEKLIWGANSSPRNRGTRFVSVRYGNVMHSRGSVIPYFKKLIQEGKTVPITHPEMTRFMLTLEDAIGLVIYATINCQGGEVFVKKAPSTKIAALAQILGEKYGRPPVQTHYIGILPGEKVHEILISEEESIRAEDRGDYFVIYGQDHKAPVGRDPWEYCSRDHIADAETIRHLLDRSEEMMAQDIFKEGYFTF